MKHRYICKGKRKDNGEWIEGYLYITHNGEYEISRYDDELDTERITYIVIPETIGRCIDLKDKNGKLIFEGDIIITNIFNTPEIRYTIVYDKEIATFIGEYKKGCVKPFTTFEGDSNCFEVIGNIHDDNPELLEVE